MTFDKVLASFLANEGKRFRRKGWPEKKWIECASTEGWGKKPHIRKPNGQEWFAGPSLLADDWEEVPNV